MNRLSEGARKAVTELLLAGAVNGFFFALLALVLWPMGKARLSAHLAGGFCVFAFVVCVVFVAGLVIQRVFRIEEDPPSNPYIILNLVLGAFLQLGWAAYAASAVTGLAAGASLWIAAVLYVVGIIASWLTTMVTGALYQGTLYKLVNALLSVAGYVLFAVWPGAGRALFGWAFVH